MDKGDINTILKNKGLVPLSREERKYLEAVHEGLMSTNLILQDIVHLIQSNKEINTQQKNNIIKSIAEQIDKNDNLLTISMQEIGYGYVFKREEY